jgi:integrase
MRSANEARGTHRQRVGNHVGNDVGGPLRVTGFRNRIWRPATVAAGLPGLRIHDLRHTAVALWIAAGASPKEVAVRAGHTSTSFVLARSMRQSGTRGRRGRAASRL